MMGPEAWLKFFIDTIFLQKGSEKAQLFLIFQHEKSIWDESVIC